MDTIKLAPGSNIGVAEDLVIKLHVPYSAESVTIQIAPNVEDYQQFEGQPGAYTMASSTTPDTQTLEFNLTNKRVRNIEFEGKAYQLVLEEIGEEPFQGSEQKYRYYQFTVSQN